MEVTSIYSNSHINHWSVKGVALLFAVLRWLAILLADEGIWVA
ncbi:hypothetical protein [Bacteroides graminisolvens]|jgi:hypothetical protein|nr:hypothetical protein [Bacteroides graminisolvens]MDD3211686.1 hypothetical protein [Bacteroides graminisolvens]